MHKAFCWNPVDHFKKSIPWKKMYFQRLTWKRNKLWNRGLGVYLSDPYRGRGSDLETAIWQWFLFLLFLPYATLKSYDNRRLYCSKMSYCAAIEVLFDDNERIWKILLGTWDREESWKALVMFLWNVNSQIASLSLLLLAVFAWEQILAGAHWLQESGTLYFLQIVLHSILPKWSAAS